jgi:LmbE family N-acetylglucosaminyl deacetylase
MSPVETQLDVLAVFSHPDDAELSVAGTLLKLKALGYRTGVCDVTRGEMGTRGTPEIRAREALDAARVMKLDLRVTDTSGRPKSRASPSCACCENTSRRCS